MTQITWDGWVEVPSATATQLGAEARGPRQADVAPRQHRAAGLSVGHDSPGGGGGGDGTGACLRGRVRAPAGRSIRARTRWCCWGRHPRRHRAGCRTWRSRCSSPRRGRAARSRFRRPPRTRTIARSLSTSRSARRGSSSCAGGRPSTRATRACTPRSSIRSTGGACRWTSISAPGARPAWSPASPRTMSRWWARSRWPTGATSTGCAWSAGRKASTTIRRTSSCRCSASTVRSRRASRSARSTRPITRARG